MTLKHSPHSAFINAKAALLRAREACPHWDDEVNSADDPYDCCYALDEAMRAARAAKKAASKVAS